MYGRFGTTAEDKSRCIESVYSGDKWDGSHQCKKPRGHGPGGEYCKAHAKEVTGMSIDNTYLSKFIGYESNLAMSGTVGYRRYELSGVQSTNTKLIERILASDVEIDAALRALLLDMVRSLKVREGAM